MSVSRRVLGPVIQMGVLALTVSPVPTIIEQAPPSGGPVTILLTESRNEF